MDLYGVLGVSRSATEAQIRRAYQKLARQLHPDLNPGDPVAVERFAQLQRAFEVLSSRDRRAAYDRGEPPPQAPLTPEVGFEGFDFSVRGSANFRELFADLTLQPADAPAQGEDLQQVARVSFEECFTGTTRQLQVVRQDLCATCAGSGVAAEPGAPCGRCRGSGQMRATRGHMIFSRRCPDCAGTGALRRACRRCDGLGRVVQAEALEVQIPPGVADGSRLRLGGAGNAGLRGGPPGDFVLVVEVEHHPRFRREGDDLHATVPVTIVEAATGAHVPVTTPDGRLPVEVPAGTQHGQRFRLRKRGMPRLGGGGRGDLYLEVQVVVPTVTDDEGRALLQEFARRHPDDPRGETEPASQSRREPRAAKRA